MTGGWAEKLRRVGPNRQQARVESHVWWDLRAGITATGLCYFYIDVSCCNTLRIPSLCFSQRPDLVGHRVWERPIGFWAPGICSGINPQPLGLSFRPVPFPAQN